MCWLNSLTRKVYCTSMLGLMAPISKTISGMLPSRIAFAFVWVVECFLCIIRKRTVIAIRLEFPSVRWRSRPCVVCDLLWFQGGSTRFQWHSFHANHNFCPVEFACFDGNC